MKKVYVNEDWCINCRLCEYNCAYANSGKSSMVNALKNQTIYPRIHVEGDNIHSFAVSCRHCEDPICVKSCICGALSKKDGVVSIDHDKCIGCRTCILVCPYGAILQDDAGVMLKCELCTKNAAGSPACVAGCPNRAIVYEERDGE